MLIKNYCFQKKIYYILEFDLCIKRCCNVH